MTPLPLLQIRPCQLVGPSAESCGHIFPDPSRYLTNSARHFQRSTPQLVCSNRPRPLHIVQAVSRCRHRQHSLVSIPQPQRRCVTRSHASQRVVSLIHVKPLWSDIRASTSSTEALERNRKMEDDRSDDVLADCDALGAP
jgi:hypothetical protein